MYEIHFSELVFAQAAKYMIVAKAAQQTKRSQICNLITSVPKFTSPVLIADLHNLSIKACQANMNRKLTVIGSFSLQKLPENSEGIIYEGQHEFSHQVEDRDVCTGRCRLKIVRRVSKQEKPDQIDIDDEFIMEDEESEHQEEDAEDKKQGQQNISSESQFKTQFGFYSGPQKCQIKLFVHCGFDFYLNSGFRVSVKWGKERKATKLVMNKISPYWGEMLNLANNESRTLQISVEDDRGSKLQWIKMKPSEIRIMYPYHLKVKFREEYMGAHPYIFLTVLREDVPRFSILDKQFQVSLKYIGHNQTSRNQQYLLIYRREVEEDTDAKLPVFMDLDMNHYIAFEMVNSLIEKNKDKKYEWNHWNLLIPVGNQSKQCLTLLKSLLNRPLVCLYFTIEKPKLFFCQQLWNSVEILERKQYFDARLKDLYYKEKRIVLGKRVELSNSEALISDENASSLEEKWKILTQNYLLRKKVLEKSFANTEQMKNQIEEKGTILESLKKVLKEVKKMNVVMVQKEKSAFVQSNKNQEKIRQNYSKFSLLDVVTSLFEKQAQLERRKHVNDEMRMRMTSLNHFNEDSTELDEALTKNAKELLEQQSMIKQMKKMKQAISKQRDVIGKLEKLFQKRQIDKNANDLLIKEKEKLEEIKNKRRKKLENVYDVVKKNKSKNPQTLLEQIAAAEKQLIKLNLEYVKIGS